MTARSVTLGQTSYPVVLPSIRDPRLHVAAVIISVHVLGQLGLDFQVTIPQILAAIVTCAVIEVALTFRKSRAFVWPASAMLTGSGVALILRVVGTSADDPWGTYAWWIFAIVAGLSLLTKYVIQFRGSHIFNPSNIGLVLAFIVLGSGVVEPLDFWWSPLDIWMIAAYAIIIGGGLLITRRLHLLPLAAAYWLALAVGIGIVSASGHCMVARWSFVPVCGPDFWWTIVTSPEVLVFLFFMITDPKTVPAGRVARVAFGLAVAIASTLFMAPQVNEFDTKVALLASLAVVSVLRLPAERFLPAAGSAEDSLTAFAGRWIGGARQPLRRAARVGLIGATAVLLAAGVVVAGAPGRGAVAFDSTEILARVPHEVDPTTFPPITVEQDVVDWSHELAGPGAQQIALTLAENLELENQALRRGDETILQAVDHGDRLEQMEGLMRDASSGGRVTVPHYAFDSMNMTLRQPFGVQTGLSLGIEGTGTVTEETYDATGSLIDSRTMPFAQTFVLRRATGGRWLNVAVLPLGADEGSIEGSGGRPAVRA
jgi:hypothetical protein